MTDAMREQAVDLDEVAGGTTPPAVGLDAVDEQLIAQLAGPEPAGCSSPGPSRRVAAGR